jgi:hypothetical protein
VIVVGCGCGGAASSVDEASAATLLGVSTAANDAGGSLSSPARCSEIGGTRAGGVSCATAAGGAIASAGKGLPAMAGKALSRKGLTQVPKSSVAKAAILCVPPGATPFDSEELLSAGQCQTAAPLPGGSDPRSVPRNGLATANTSLGSGSSMRKKPNSFWLRAYGWTVRRNLVSTPLH